MADPLKNAPVKGMRKRFPRVFGRYILEKSLSRGGMGEVMLAVARHVNERCVIKTIRTDLTGDEEFVGRFADEAKIMVRIEHPNIIRGVRRRQGRPRLLHRDAVRARPGPR